MTAVVAMLEIEKQSAHPVLADMDGCKNLFKLRGDPIMKGSTLVKIPSALELPL